MCGIVGVIAKGTSGFFKNQMDVFHELLYVDNFRGDDSTGILMVDRDGDLKLAKGAYDAPTFQKQKEYHELMRETFQRGKVIIGHNRKATKGSITDENAHPFVVDNRIVLVHNGTLWGDFKKLLPEGATADVDSHAIAHLIHKHDGDVEKAVQEIQGAYTLVWFDMKLQTLNFLRNTQRPLAFMETNDSWVLASEKNMLEWMANRHSMKVLVPPTELGDGIHSIFTLNNKGGWDVSQKEITLTKTTTYGGNYYGECGDMSQYACGHWPGAPVLDATEDDEGSILPNGQFLPNRDVGALRAALREMENRSTVFEQASNDHVTSTTQTTGTVGSAEDVTRRRRLSAGYAIRKEEEVYAIAAQAHITSKKFSQLSGDFEDGKRYHATAFQYTYVNNEDGTGGYFIYAWLQNSDSFMVRAYVPPEFDEMKLCDLTANKRSITLKIQGRVWRRFENEQDRNADGDGHALFYGDEVKKVIGIVNGKGLEVV